jgi:hypothetical protein
MENRRTFLKMAATARALARPVVGANGRVQMGIIGTGTRAITPAFTAHPDAMFVTEREVDQFRLAKGVGWTGKTSYGWGDAPRAV